MLVYLSACMLRNGEGLLPTALTDRESLIGKNLIVDEKRGTHKVKDEALKEALYHDCSESDASWASSLLVPESNAAVATPLSLTEKRYGSVDRTYIRCSQDRGVTPSLQGRMLAATPCGKVVSLKSSHSPFLSMPEEVAKILMSG